MFESIERMVENLDNFHLDEIYKERSHDQSDLIEALDRKLAAKEILIKALVMTLEYYSIHSVYNDIRVGVRSIYLDQGQRARNTLSLYQEFKDAEELDAADVAELERAHKGGFCSDINLPKGFKFIEVNETE